MPTPSAQTSPTNDNTPSWIWTTSTDVGVGLADPAYALQWSQDQTFSNGVSNATSSTSAFSHSSILSDGTWYFRVRASDNLTNTSSYSDNGTVIIDTTPPTANNVTVTNISTTTASVSWETDESSDSYVEYGVSTSYGLSSPLSNSNTNHTIELSGLDAGTIYHYRIVSSDSLENQSTSPDQTFYTQDSPNTSPDSDSDGTPDSVEDNSPNNGDANGDNIPDSTQANVTSFKYNGTHYLVLETACNTNYNVQNGLESNEHKDSAYDYSVGLLAFVGQDCGTPGSTVPIKLYYYGDFNPSELTLRKWHDTTYSTIPGTTLSNSNIGGQSVLQAAYNITDGGDLDQDGQADGTIVDPVGLGKSTVGSPNTGLGALAETGDSLTYAAATSLVLITSGAVLALHNRKAIYRKASKD